MNIPLPPNNSGFLHALCASARAFPSPIRFFIAQRRRGRRDGQTHNPEGEFNGIFKSNPDISRSIMAGFRLSPRPLRLCAGLPIKIPRF
jgi:hypothetical protein